MPVGAGHARLGAAPPAAALPGSDQWGRPIDRRVENFHARVVQHEVDHLDGVLYPTRIKDLRKFGFVEELFPGQQLQDE